MHHNYYFLLPLSQALDYTLKGYTLMECYSQNKDELTIGFTNGTQDFFMKASMASDLAAFAFPDVMHRSRRNSVDLFKAAVGRKVTQVSSGHNERALAIALEDQLHLVFKMHGNRSNALLFESGTQTERFRKNLHQDSQYTLESMVRHIDQSKEAFMQAEGNYEPMFPTFGKQPKQWLRQHNYLTQPLQQKWQLMEQLLGYLQAPTFSVAMQGDLPVLTLLPQAPEDTLLQTTDPLAAANEFYFAFARLFHLNKEKKAILQQVEKQAKQAHQYIQKTQRKLDELAHNARHEEIANIIMANLHQMPANASSATLFDFYRNEDLEIKLKPTLSPQKNAEAYYRKAKNRKIEIKKLEENIAAKKAQHTSLSLQREQLAQVQSIKELKAFHKGSQHQQQGPRNKESLARPYHAFEFDGFKILVGKSGKANDEVTTKHAHKDDLWLHAKDVAGSHVIIRQKPGQNFPNHVIEYAAQLAAHFSKGKNDTLCPVQYTLRKYIRKPKGMAPGQVIVDREEVILVPPTAPDN